MHLPNYLNVGETVNNPNLKKKRWSFPLRQIGLLDGHIHNTLGSYFQACIYSSHYLNGKRLKPIYVIICHILK